MTPTRTAAQVALMFAAVSAVWIVVSDILVGIFSAQDVSLLQGLQLLKGG